MYRNLLAPLRSIGGVAVSRCSASMTQSPGHGERASATIVKPIAAWNLLNRSVWNDRPDAVTVCSAKFFFNCRDREPVRRENGSSIVTKLPPSSQMPGVARRRRLSSPGWYRRSCRAMSIAERIFQLFGDNSVRLAMAKQVSSSIPQRNSL